MKTNLLHLDRTTIAQNYEHVLQYKTLIEITDYGAIDPATKNFVCQPDWSLRINVPKVNS